MRTSPIMVFLILSLTALTGCDELKNAALGKGYVRTPAKPVEAPLVKHVDSPELAMVILKPERKKLIMSRDPFKPLLTRETSSSGITESEFGQTTQAQMQGNLEDVVVVGVIKLGDEYRAYLKSNNKTGVYKQQDTIGQYTIERIKIDQVTFKVGDTEIIKKRGKK